MKLKSGMKLVAFCVCYTTVRLLVNAESVGADGRVECQCIVCLWCEMPCRVCWLFTNTVLLHIFYLCVLICTLMVILKRYLYSMFTTMCYVRTFQGRDPGVMIFDVDMLKDVLVKDASNFRNRYVRYYTSLWLDWVLIWSIWLNKIGCSLPVNSCLSSHSLLRYDTLQYDI